MIINQKKRAPTKIQPSVTNTGIPSQSSTSTFQDETTDLKISNSNQPNINNIQENDKEVPKIDDDIEQDLIDEQ